MKQSYLPIPNGDTSTVTATAFRPADQCLSAKSDSDTASLSIEASGTPLEYTPFSESKWRNAPTDGEWSAVRRSGSIKMTEMHAGRVTEDNSLGVIDHNAYAFAFALVGTAKGLDQGVCKNCVNHTAHCSHELAHISWTEQGDLSYWKEKYPTAPHARLKVEENPARVERLKSSCFQELFQGFNLGEEVYELRDTLRLASDLIGRGAKILSDFKSYSKSLKPSDVPNAWLEARYGILPVLYSIKDIKELMDSQGRYRTTRRSYNAQSSSDDLPSDDIYFYDQGAIAKTYRITCKGRWGSSREKILDLINVNPLTTAAAVFPYSLVVRWFINLNSVIDSYVKSFTSSASEFHGCVSVKTNSDVSTFMHFSLDESATLYWNGNSPGCGAGFYPPYGPFNEGGMNSGDVFLRRKTEDTYSRTLFQPTDVSFTFDPNLNLSRVLDGLSFLTQRNRNLLRRL